MFQASSSSSSSVEKPILELELCYPPGTAHGMVTKPVTRLIAGKAKSVGREDRETEGYHMARGLVRGLLSASP